MWILETIDDPAPASVRVSVAPGELKTIGRAAPADVILEKPLVSRLHCRLTAGPTECEIADLNSTNGTFVNGRRITRALLAPGDRIGIGRVSLRVSRDE